ncbi:MAG: hypothetical protein NTW96_24680 [Planctomycetia bacterium]|nr:hypothetical protein [Planctomycetia bacterium]
MACSWLIVQRDGKRNAVDLRTKTRKGIGAAVKRTNRTGAKVIAAYLGGPGPIALCRKVYPAA